MVGISIGPTGNLFLITPVSTGQPCSVIEVDFEQRYRGVVLPTHRRRPTGVQQYVGLIYDSQQNLFYSYFPSNASTYVYNVTVHPPPQNKTPSFFGPDGKRFDLPRLTPPPEQIQAYDLQESGTAGQLMNTQINLFVEDVENPVDFAMGPCPRAASTPAASSVPPPSGGVNVVSVVVPVVLGSMFLFLICLLLAVGLMWMYSQRHRKYFDSGDLIEDTEAGTPMKEIKFTFRFDIRFRSFFLFFILFVHDFDLLLVI